MTAVHMGGRRWRRVTIQALASTPRDAYGGEPETATTLLERDAIPEPEGQGREAYRGGQPRGEVRWTFTFRYDALLAAVTPRNQLVMDGQSYDIESVVDYRDEHHTIVVTAIHREAA